MDVFLNIIVIAAAIGAAIAWIAYFRLRRRRRNSRLWAKGEKRWATGEAGEPSGKAPAAKPPFKKLLLAK